MHNGFKTNSRYFVNITSPLGNISNNYITMYLNYTLNNTLDNTLNNNTNYKNNYTLPITNNDDGNLSIVILMTIFMVMVIGACFICYVNEQEHNRELFRNENLVRNQEVIRLNRIRQEQFIRELQERDNLDINVVIDILDVDVLVNDDVGDVGDGIDDEDDRDAGNYDIQIV
jgi:hypothetical protein